MGTTLTVMITSYGINVKLLHCTLETTITLYVNYTLIKNKLKISKNFKIK